MDVGSGEAGGICETESTPLRENQPTELPAAPSQSTHNRIPRVEKVTFKQKSLEAQGHR